MTEAEAVTRIETAQKVVKAACENDLLDMRKMGESEFIRVANELVTPLGVGVRKATRGDFWYEFFIALTTEVIGSGYNSKPVRADR